MPEWLISLISVIVGAAIGIGGTEFVQWYKRPKLEIDFEEYEGQKPYVLDLFLESQDDVPFSRNKAKFLRLNVRNAGRKAAVGCEAKMVIVKNKRKEPFRLSLHWSRRDPTIYKPLDEIYKPIDLNPRDEEPVDMLMLHYQERDPKNYLVEPSVVVWKTITTMSPRVYHFEANTAYRIKVTVYAGNTISKPFTLKLFWDGTLVGFYKAFQKGNKD